MTMLNRLKPEVLLRNRIKSIDPNKVVVPVGSAIGVGLGLKFKHDYERDLEYQRRALMAQYNKLQKVAGIGASIKSLATNALKSKYPEFFQDAIEVNKGKNGISVKFNGPHNIPNDLINAASNISDDPGNHKKKALIGAAGTVAGIALTKKYYTDAIKETAKDMLKDAPTSNSKGSLVASLISAATPAAIYYAIQNRDRPERAGLGIGFTTAAVDIANDHRKNIKASTTGLDPKFRSSLARADASLGLAVGAGLYTVHQLQVAADEAKLKSLETSNINDEDKAKEINRIRGRKDFLTRYPIFRPAPYSERLRSIYNKFHPPVPQVSKEDFGRFFTTKVTS